ncbi:hypothetical protein [Pedobacter sp. SYSU D00535]|uniref:hypothetical protein n=1 Tax=Pedobacter sp. SYSU D00535 TaxID=2810308 RepID=UPI001A9785EA|nr:hypothetical protein [Pedobacter sp. SYSU D00535]
MKEPFDVEFDNRVYAIFPEEDNTYTVFKDGLEYMKLQQDTEGVWIRLDLDTDTPLFEEDTEANEIGKAILAYEPEPDEDQDQE